MNLTKISFCKMIIVLYVLFTSIITKTYSQSGCIVPGVSDPQIAPLIVDSSFRFRDPMNPTSSSVSFGFAESIYIACPGGRFSQPGLNPNGQLITCRGGTVFNAKGLMLNYTNLNCTLGDLTRPALGEAYDNPDIYCENRTRPLEAGYYIAGNLTSVFSVCFDMNHLVPLYTKHELTSWARSIQNHRLLPTYHFFLIELFTEDAERPYETIASTFENLGLQEYINQDHYLVKGLLAPYEDFFYPFQRDATYNLANAAPRWNTINQGNWKALEDAIAFLVESRIYGDKATILTGTLNVATLTNSSEVLVPLYLYSMRYPVPKWFWKLVYFPTTNAGAIFFAYNNPYAEKLTVDFEFTNEICSIDAYFELQQTWTVLKDIEKDDPNLGLLYACHMIPGEIVDPTINEIVTNI